MCGRMTITKSEGEIAARFDAEFDDQEGGYAANYNAAPTHLLPIITASAPKCIQLYRWGLIPFWAKDEKVGYKMINARIETLMEKSAFNTAARSRRCIVPMDGFYEWQRNGKLKTPYRISMKDESLFSAAGLWESWTDAKGNNILSFTVITQPPNDLMQDIHDRMPAILTQDQESQWLNQAIPAAEAIAMIQPYPSDLMRAYQVDNRVGKVSENDPHLLDPVNNLPEAIQGSLFG